MHRLALLCLALAACGPRVRGITTDAVLGRVVIYRNGVAFYERTARLVDGKVTVHVPRDRVDDFLKSLTVVDPATRTPLAVSIPRQEAADGSYLTMSLETSDRREGDVLLTYVTESPAWKPSYRVVVGGAGKVMLEGWAIVDNVSGEDWKNVLVGVGASSALSFRYDLWSVQRIDRDLLAGEQRFALAPPTGMSPYVEGATSEELVSLDASELREPVTMESPPADETTGTLAGVIQDAASGEKLAGVTVIVTSPSLAQTQTAVTDENGAYTVHGLPPGQYLVTFYYADVTVERSGIFVRASKTTPVYQRLNSASAGSETIKIRDTAPTIDPTATAQGITFDRETLQRIDIPGRTYESTLGAAPGTTSSSRTSTSRPSPIKQGDDKLARAAKTILESKRDVLVKTQGATLDEARARATTVKNKLVDDGIPAARIYTQPEVGTDPRVRVLAVTAPAQAATAPAHEATARHAATATAARPETPDTPVGESHFIAERPMNVRAGTSAMVAMVRAETSGGIVYLYDPLSERGDERFAFKAVRLDNPTADTLEPGPVTVYGQGRFIGEGITEPVPPRSSIVVPFALDRQIVVSRNGSESDRIAKLVTAERGVIRAELQHRREARFSVTSRLQVPSKVYVRHRLESGWTLVEAPPRHMRVGDSELFEVDVGPGATVYVTIAEATPIERSLDLASSPALEMMRVYVDEPGATPQLKAQIAALLATHRSGAELTDRIATLREQLAEYRQRAAELHGQVVTLKAVRSGGELTTQLKSRLGEMNERMQKTTLAIVDSQEKLMLARVKLQNQIADLRLVDATEPLSKR